MEKKEESHSNIILWILLLIFSLLVIFLVYTNVRTKKEFQQTIENLERTVEERDSLQIELEQIYVQYQQLKTNNDSLNKKLDVQKERVAQLIQELRRVKVTDKQKIEQLKQEVALLRNIMRSYIRQIDSLYQKNQILVEENRKIKEQYTAVIIEKQELEQVADSLKKTVEIASTLQARPISFLALNKRDKETKRIRKTNKFQICFTLLANQIANKGVKKVYLRIARPDGEILINENSSTFNYQGKEIFYSAMKEVDYQGKDTQVCIYYLNSTELPAGKYVAYIFVDDKQVLTTDITLK